MARGYTLVPFFLFLLVAPIVNLKIAGAQDYEASEYEIKASYLMNFPSFVDWPDSASADLQAPLRVCLLGQDPLRSRSHE